MITGWWMRNGVSPEFPQLKNNAYRVRTQADVLMPGENDWKGPHGSTLPDSMTSPESITKGEVQRTATSVLRFVLQNKKN